MNENVSGQNMVYSSEILKISLNNEWFILGGTVLLIFLALIISFLLPTQFRSTSFFKLTNGYFGEGKKE